MSEEHIHYCHHDTLALTERDITLMYAFQLWVDTVRKSPRYSEAWLPSEIDIIKSRLFWWIRSGNTPLPHPPPTAYSCPWYEVITETGLHGALELSIMPPEGFNGVFAGKINISQCMYNLIDKISDEELIVGFGPYKWRATRSLELYAKRLALYNPRQPDIEVRILKEGFRDAYSGWFLERIDEELPRPQAPVD